MTEADDIAWGDNPRGTYEKALERIAELEAERDIWLEAERDIWINAAKLACSDKEKVAAERDRLRKALQKIIEYGETGTFYIAKQALEEK